MKITFNHPEELLKALRDGISLLEIYEALITKLLEQIVIVIIFNMFKAQIFKHTWLIP